MRQEFSNSQFWIQHTWNMKLSLGYHFYQMCCHICFFGHILRNPTSLWQISIANTWCFVHGFKIELFYDIPLIWMILLNIVWFVILKDNSPIPQSLLTPPPLLQYDPADNIFGSSMTNKTTTHPKFSSTLVQTHGLQIMTVHFMYLRWPS